MARTRRVSSARPHGQCHRIQRHRALCCHYPSKLADFAPQSATMSTQLTRGAIRAIHSNSHGGTARLQVGLMSRVRCHHSHKPNNCMLTVSRAPPHLQVLRLKPGDRHRYVVGAAFAQRVCWTFRCRAVMAARGTHAWPPSVAPCPRVPHATLLPTLSGWCCRTATTTSPQS